MFPGAVPNALSASTANFSGTLLTLKNFTSENLSLIQCETKSSFLTSLFFYILFWIFFWLNRSICTLVNESCCVYLEESKYRNQQHIHEMHEARKSFHTPTVKSENCVRSWLTGYPQGSENRLLKISYILPYFCFAFPILHNQVLYIKWHKKWKY